MNYSFYPVSVLSKDENFEKHRHFVEDSMTSKGIPNGARYSVYLLHMSKFEYLKGAGDPLYDLKKFYIVPTKQSAYDFSGIEHLGDFRLGEE